MKGLILGLIIIIAAMFVAAVVMAWIFEKACILITKLSAYLRNDLHLKYPTIYRVLVTPYKLVIKWLYRRT